MTHATPYIPSLFEAHAMAALKASASALDGTGENPRKARALVRKALGFSREGIDLANKDHRL